MELTHEQFEEALAGLVTAERLGTTFFHFTSGAMDIAYHFDDPRNTKRALALLAWAIHERMEKL